MSHMLFQHSRRQAGRRAQDRHRKPTMPDKVLCEVGIGVVLVSALPFLLVCLDSASPMPTPAMPCHAMQCKGMRFQKHRPKQTKVIQIHPCTHPFHTCAAYKRPASTIFPHIIEPFPEGGRRSRSDMQCQYGGHCVRFPSTYEDGAYCTV
jgi:hypothetical protein